jgi:hypothetical protein
VRQRAEELGLERLELTGGCQGAGAAASLLRHL